MNKIFFIADTHFRHDFIAKKRNFETTEAHDNFLIAEWNAKVDNGDRIYILGDITMRGIDIKDILKQLNGEKYLIIGNHDSINRQNHAYYEKYFVWIKDVFMLKIKNGANIPSTKIWLSHYPHEVWPDDHYGSFHFHGHVHGYCRHKPLQKMPNRFDVGITKINHSPYEMNEIFKILIDNNLWKKDYKEELKRADEDEKNLELLLNVVPFGFMS